MPKVVSGLAAMPSAKCDGASLEIGLARMNERQTSRVAAQSGRAANHTTFGHLTPCGILAKPVIPPIAEFFHAS
jgi:hypothetical protein